VFFLSNSMPKSASTLLSYMQVRAIQYKYGDNGQVALINATSKGVIDGVNSYVNNCSSYQVLCDLHDLSQEHGPFVVKTHIGINDHLKRFVLEGKVKCSYIYRRPHDVVLSGMDNYKKNPVEFPRFSSLSGSVEKVVEYCEEALGWVNSNATKVVRYEDFIANPGKVLDEVMQYFGIYLEQKELEDILIASREMQSSSASWNLRFNKGISDRYLSEMSDEEIIYCDSVFNRYLTYLGY